MKFDDGSNFRVESMSAMPLVLQSGAVLQLKISFLPKTNGAIFDTLTLTTSDPDQPTVTIVVKGKGTK